MLTAQTKKASNYYHLLEGGYKEVGGGGGVKITFHIN